MSTTIWNPSDKSAGVGVYGDGSQAAGPASPSAWSAVRGTTAKANGYFEVALRSISASAQAVVGVADAAMSLSGYPGQTPKSAGIQWVNSALAQPFVSGVTLAIVR